VQVTAPEQLRRTDVLDAGRDSVPLRERWRWLDVPGRLGLAALLTAALGTAGTLAWHQQADEQREQREQAAGAAVVRIDARLLTARARGPAGTRELRFLATNAGPLRLSVRDGSVTLTAAGRLDVAVQPLDLDPGESDVLRVRAARPDCPRTPPPPVADSLVLEVVTADGRTRAAPVELREAVWSQVARALPCRAGPG
jgi:hypothetical protein